MRNILFLNVSKNKIKSGGFYYFHVDDAQNNFLGFLSLIIVLEQTFFFFFEKKQEKNYQFINKIESNILIYLELVFESILLNSSRGYFIIYTINLR